MIGDWPYLPVFNTLMLKNVATKHLPSAILYDTAILGKATNGETWDESLETELTTAESHECVPFRKNSNVMRRLLKYVVA